MHDHSLRSRSFRILRWPSFRARARNSGFCSTQLWAAPTPQLPHSLLSRPLILRQGILIRVEKALPFHSCGLFGDWFSSSGREWRKRFYYFHAARLEPCFCPSWLLLLMQPFAFGGGRKFYKSSSFYSRWSRKVIKWFLGLGRRLQESPVFDFPGAQFNRKKSHRKWRQKWHGKRHSKFYY